MKLTPLEVLIMENSVREYLIELQVTDPPYGWSGCIDHNDLYSHYYFFLE